MAYQPIQPPANTPEIIRQLLRAGVDPFFADVHAMLRLPLPSAEIGAGCGFAIAHVLLATVSGLSVLLYQSQGGSGKLFREFLEQYYPWHDEPKLQDVALGHAAAETLYDEYRNHFTHALGLAVEVKGGNRKLAPREYVIKVLRKVVSHSPDGNDNQGVREIQIEELETENVVRPKWLVPTLIAAPHKRVLSVEALYWGVRKAIIAVCGDEDRMAEAANFLTGPKPRPPET